MRTPATMLMVIVSFFIFCPTVHAQSSTKTKLIFSYEDKHNFPFYMDNGEKINWDKPGVSIEFLKLLEKRLDIEIHFVRQPWNRCKMSLSTGDVDGIFNASFEPKRMKIGSYPMKGTVVDSSRRITTIAYVLYKLKDSLLSWDPINKKISAAEGEICAPLGYSIVDDLKGWGLNVYERDTTQTCFKILSLRKDRFAAIAALELAGDYYLSKNREMFKNLVKVSPPLVEKPYYLMLSHQFIKKNKPLAEAIWDTIAKLRPTQMKRISAKYF